MKCYFYTQKSRNKIIFEFVLILKNIQKINLHKNLKYIHNKAFTNNILIK